MSSPTQWAGIPLLKLRKDLRKQRLEVLDRSQQTIARNNFYNRSKAEPSLPKFKCLED